MLLSAAFTLLKYPDTQILADSPLDDEAFQFLSVKDQQFLITYWTQMLPCNWSHDSVLSDACHVMLPFTGHQEWDVLPRTLPSEKPL